MKQKTQDIIIGVQLAGITIIITIGIALLASGCQAEPGDPPDANIPAQVSPEPPRMDWELTGLRAVGPLFQTYNEGITCLITGEDPHIDLVVTDLDTDSPSIPVRPGMECDELRVDDRWVLWCKEFDMTGWFFHWTYFRLYLDAEWPHHGVFYWDVDGLPYFYCVREFHIDDVTPYYRSQ